jgi:1-acyl-sn-glycerol-3-phosphate acyltransferase
MGRLYSSASRVFEAGFLLSGVDLTVEGLEHLPRSGPAIVASNHIGYLDFAFVMLAPPRPRREMAFLARGDLFERRFTGRALRALGQIPVDEHGDPAGTLRVAREHLERGGILGLHPEGTVNPTFLPIRGKSGAIRLAQQTGAPIIPTSVWGSQRLLTKWRPPAWPERGIAVRVTYGEPYVPPVGPASGSTRELMARITSLVELAIADEGAPPGSWWVPAEHGGGAPRLAEVDARLEAQVEERRGRQRRTAQNATDGRAEPSEKPSRDPSA